MKSGTNLGVLLVLSALFSSPQCFAQSVADKAAAEALFDDGVNLLDAGDYEAACKKLEDSQRVDPGIGTLLYLADCYEKSGRTASAWATFREAASLASNAGQDERAEVATQRADALESKLSRLAIEVVPQSQLLKGFLVKRDEEEIPAAVFGASVPVDPGQYTVTASAPGYLPVQVVVEVGVGAAAETVSIPALQVDPATRVEAAPVKPEPVVVPPPPAPQKPRGRGQRTTGLVLGGVGILGLGAGSVLGFMAIDSNNQAFDPNVGNCGDALCPPGPGTGLINEAYDFATGSTIAFIAGGSLLGLGAVLYLTAPKGMEAQATKLEFQPVAQGGTVTLGGSF